MLLRLAQQLRTLGITAFIPHRDVNRWGRRVLPADTVARECSDGVDRCDVFIGILGMSHGSHYEFGLALGLGKPCVILSCSQLTESFLAGGFRTTMRSNVLVLQCDRMSSIPRLFQSVAVTSFLARFVPLER